MDGVGLCKGRGCGQGQQRESLEEPHGGLERGEMASSSLLPFADVQENSSMAVELVEVGCSGKMMRGWLS